MKRTTVEEYDNKGRLKKRTITTEEEMPNPVYLQPYVPLSPTIPHDPPFWPQPGTTIIGAPQWSYTSVAPHSSNIQ